MLKKGFYCVIKKDNFEEISKLGIRNLNERKLYIIPRDQIELNKDEIVLFVKPNGLEKSIFLANSKPPIFKTEQKYLSPIFIRFPNESLGND